VGRRRSEYAFVKSLRPIAKLYDFDSPRLSQAHPSAGPGNTEIGPGLADLAGSGAAPGADVPVEQIPGSGRVPETRAECATPAAWATRPLPHA
jgi:hypothetical protein